MRDQVMYSNNFVKLNFKKKKLVLWKLIFTSVFYYRQKIVCFQWWWYDQHLKKNVFDRLFFQKQLECKKTSGSDQLVFLHPSGKNQQIHRTHPYSRHYSNDNILSYVLIFLSTTPVPGSIDITLSSKVKVIYLLDRTGVYTAGH